MKNYLTKIATPLILTICSGFLLIGLELNNPYVILAFELFIALCMAALFLTTVSQLIHFIIALHKRFRKKKMKDKRNKVKVKVVFDQMHHGVKHLLTQTYSAPDLERGIAKALAYAEVYKCTIKSIELLTTE